MPPTVLILGANGRFGRHASLAFANDGWHVHGFARSWPATSRPALSKYITGDAFNADEIIKAAKACDIIVNAVNPPYTNWAEDLPRLTSAVIDAAKATGAAIMLPGNVYNYGANMPAILREDTPHAPTTKKGQLRENMELRYKQASQQGVQTIILRGGDFIEAAVTGNWFDSYIIPKLASGKITYPGPHNQTHAWAYLPDMARAMTGLANQRRELPPFSTFGFENFNLTGTQLISAIERSLGRTLKVKTVPWTMMKGLGLFSPTIKEVLEMRYLWQVPHAIDGTKLEATLAGFTHTSLDNMLKDVLQSAA